LEHHCFTLKFTGISRVMITPVAISSPTVNYSSPKYQTRCIWDTGCSTTTITQNVVDALGLKPTGVTTVNTASATNVRTSTFQIDFFLSDNLVFQNITVNLGVICDGIDCLLGMDIIGTGDLSITNHLGNTCMSFRHPSSHEIDFNKNPTIGIRPEKHIPPGKSGSNQTQKKKKRR
jgi:predicted aspartyl protease